MFWKKKKTIEKKESAAGSVISFQNVGQPVWSGRNFEAFAKEGYIQNVIAHRCISLIAKGIAGVSWQVFSGEKEFKSHPLLDLLAKPNERQAGCDFFEAVASFQLIAGNSYIEAAYPGGDVKPNVAPPKFLYSLPPQNMTIIPGKFGLPIGYKFEVSSKQVTYPVGPTGISNILQLRNFNPVDHWYGLSNVEAGAFAIDQHNSASSWNQALLQNGASPKGALLIKGNKDQPATLGDDQYDRLKEQIDSGHTGPRNAGKPLLLEGGLEWQEMSMTPKEMDWLAGKDSVARDVALAFGVPSQLLGIPGDSTYNNMMEARLSLWEQTIIPQLDELTAHLNSWLVPRYGSGLELKYSKENIDALRVKREAQRSSLETVSFMTINEKRAAIGLEPLDGGDELLVDSNKIPVTLANDPGKDINSTESFVKTLKDLGFKDKEIKQMVLEDV